MGKSASAAFSMMRLVLAISALASLAGTGLGERLMSALYTCDYTTYAKKSAGEGQDEDWHEALARRSLNRQDNCHSVAEIEQDFLTYAAYGLCLWEQVGWYDLDYLGWITFNLYESDVSSLAPSVAASLQWDGAMGQCWSNMTSDVYDYFEGCDYSDEDWSTLIGVIFAWSDLTCFGYIFDDSCSSYLKNEIYYCFGQYSDYYSDYYDYYYNYNDYYDYYSYYYGKKAEKTN